MLTEMFWRRKGNRQTFSTLGPSLDTCKCRPSFARLQPHLVLYQEGRQHHDDNALASTPILISSFYSADRKYISTSLI